MRPRRPGRRPSRLAALAPQGDGQRLSLLAAPMRPSSAYDHAPTRDSAEQIKGGEAPKGACQPCAAHRRQVYAVCATHLPRGCAPLSEARPPSGASTAALAGTPILQAMLPGSRIKRALPALSRPSAVAAPHASAVIPKGMMPEAAPARVASPRGSTALAPHCGSHPECVPGERDSSGCI